MDKEFSTSWKSSTRPGKQRKYRYQAPLHIKHRFCSAHLSKELRQKYGRRSIEARKGDKAKVMTGQFRKREGKIERVDIKKTRIYITGIEMTKKDGSKSIYPLHPSNIMITELNLEDKKRKASLERKAKK
jgi:large subunit ribosomal protein L24